METVSGPFDILYQDDDLVAIDKPPAYHVHPPENDRRVPRSLICLSLLRKQIGRYVYPVHRLDVATSGVLLWALNKEAASLLNRAFLDRQVEKRYRAVARGFTADEFSIELPLELDSTGALADSRTDFRKIAQVEWDIPVGKKFPRARYTYLEAYPRTGRYHQIRRHLNRVSSPIVGDTDHGDSHHNRFFREHWGIQGLCLRAFELKLKHPRTGQDLAIEAPMNEKWRRIESLFSSKNA